jgi:hypothetical protein
MKTQLFAAAAILAVAVSAPAFAQNIGSVGAAVDYNNIDTNAGSADGTSVVIDGSVAIPTGSWTITGAADVSIADSDVSQRTVATGAVHATTVVGNGLRIGGFTALSRPSNDTLWAVGGEAQKYLGNTTLTGLVAYGQSNDLDADLWTVRAGANYFVSDDFRLDGGLGWSKVDGRFADADIWDISVGGEYKFANTGWSTFAKYTHSEADDLADLKSDAVKVGLRYTFGGSLKARNASGADLATGSDLFGFLAR